MKTTLLFTTFSLFSSAFASGYFSTHECGWHWYQTQPELDHQPEDEKSSEKISAQEQLQQFQRRFEEIKAEAVMNPTPTTISAYQKMQYELLEKSHKFAQIWMQNVYKDPAIDYSLQSPSSQNARHIYYRQQTEEKERKISQLSRDYGLFYFFKKDCGYCDAFAPVVKRFSEKYRWEVLAISEFGEKSPLFARNVADNGLAEIWNVSVYPSLFAVNPKTGHVIPVAHGMIAIEEMEERITKIIEGTEGEKKDE